MAQTRKGKRHCPQAGCDGFFPSRQGWKVVPGLPSWSRRCRTCNECGHREDHFELPARELEEYVRLYDAVTELRSILGGMQLDGDHYMEPESVQTIKEIFGL